MFVLSNYVFPEKVIIVSQIAAIVSTLKCVTLKENLPIIIVLIAEIFLTINRVIYR